MARARTRRLLRVRSHQVATPATPMAMPTSQLARGWRFMQAAGRGHAGRTGPEEPDEEDGDHHDRGRDADGLDDVGAVALVRQGCLPLAACGAHRFINRPIRIAIS